MPLPVCCRAVLFPSAKLYRTKTTVYSLCMYNTLAFVINTLARQAVYMRVLCVRVCVDCVALHCCCMHCTCARAEVEILRRRAYARSGKMYAVSSARLCVCIRSTNAARSSESSQLFCDYMLLLYAPRRVRVSAIVPRLFTQAQLSSRVLLCSCACAWLVLLVCMMCVHRVCLCVSVCRLARARAHSQCGPNGE